MSLNNKDYYQILDVSQDATVKEIKQNYKKLMMEKHPDRFKGLKAKYEAEGDDVLLEVLEEKIRQAEEACKLINEAYAVLSDPARRRTYDEEIYEPKVSVPEIVISPTMISFGILNEGRSKSETFTIENKGGPVVAVQIDWEDNPDWGKMFIEPDPEETFPIRVTIKVDTTGIPSGPKSQKILVNVDGMNYEVEVTLVVAAVKTTVLSGVKTSPPSGTRTPRVATTGPTSGLSRLVVVIGVLTVLVIVWGIASASNAAQRQRQRRADAAVVYEQQQEDKRMKFKEDPPFTISNIKRISYKEIDEGVSGEFYSEEVYILFDVTNEWDSGYLWGGPSEMNCMPYERIEGGETLHYSCRDLSSEWDVETNSVVPKDSSGPILDEICLTFTLMFPELSPPALMVTKCAKVPAILTWTAGSEFEEAKASVTVEIIGIFEEAYVRPFSCWKGEHYKSEMEASCREPEVIAYRIENNWRGSVRVRWTTSDVRNYKVPEFLDGCCTVIGPNAHINLLSGEGVDAVQRITDAQDCLEVFGDGLPPWKLCLLDYVDK